MGRAQVARNYFYGFTESPDSLGQRGFSLVLIDQRDDVTRTVDVREGTRWIIARRFRIADELLAAAPEDAKP